MDTQKDLKCTNVQRNNCFQSNEKCLFIQELLLPCFSPTAIITFLSMPPSQARTNRASSIIPIQ
jgi:hypothetical protein